MVLLALTCHRPSRAWSGPSERQGEPMRRRVSLDTPPGTFSGTLGELLKRKRQNDDPYHVPWLEPIAPTLARKFRFCVDRAVDERPIQRFLEKHPTLLVRHLTCRKGRCVLPQKRLGAEFVPDCVVSEKDSGVHKWWLVELESPRARLFTNNGVPARELSHAMRQVREWRSWLRANRPYAVQPRSEKGLGLTGIDATAQGLILIGREASLGPDDVERRKELEADTPHLTIHTYDWLLNLASPQG